MCVFVCRWGEAVRGLSSASGGASIRVSPVRRRCYREKETVREQARKRIANRGRGYASDTAELKDQLNLRWTGRLKEIIICD